MSLYNKFRPITFTDMKGDYSYVGDMLTQKSSNHAYLFMGPRGTGKTTTARICLRMLGLEDWDIDEYNFADTNGIDTVRQIIQDAKYSGMHGFVIDEVHKATESAQQAMLKLLEDIPDNIYFFLCTSEPKKMIPALRDRPIKIPFHAVAKEDLKVLVSDIAVAEGSPIKSKISSMIAEKAQGSARHAINLLETVLVMDEDRAFDYMDAYEGSEEDSPQLIDIARLVFDPAAMWKDVSPKLKAYKEAQGDAEALRRVLLGYGASILLNNFSPILCKGLAHLEANVYDSGMNGLIVKIGEFYIERSRP